MQNKLSNKSCSRCQKPFICQPENIAHCNCNSVSLSEDETRFISAQYPKDCICNACLQELKQVYQSTPKTRAVFCWSGGKDSAYALHHVITGNQYTVAYLLTTINKTLRRISMHGVREELLDAQAGALGFPLLKVEVGEEENGEYEKQMAAVLLKAKSEGIEHVIFGDIFLEDLRAYREANLAKVGMKAVFPLWKQDTKVIIRSFIDREFKSVLCCTSDAQLGEGWLGREINDAFIGELPPAVDPCGENGEYHSFCYDGPVFKQRLNITTGEKIYKPLDLKTTAVTANTTVKGFWFIDLLLKRDSDVMSH